MTFCLGTSTPNSAAAAAAEAAPVDGCNGSANLEACKVLIFSGAPSPDFFRPFKGYLTENINVQRKATLHILCTSHRLEFLPSRMV